MSGFSHVILDSPCKHVVREGVLTVGGPRWWRFLLRFPWSQVREPPARHGQPQDGDLPVAGILQSSLDMFSRTSAPEAEVDADSKARALRASVCAQGVINFPGLEMAMACHG